MSKTQILIAALIWVGTSLSIQAQQRGYRFINNKQIVETPFKLINNLPVIEVTINKRKKLNFVLDTGMRTTIVFSKNYLKGLNYSFGREVRFSGVGSERLIHGKVVPELTLNIGEVEGNGVSILVINENQRLKRQFKNLNVHGIIGYELFTRFVVEIDYHNRMVSFCEHEYYNFGDVYEQMPLLVQDTKPYIYASLKLSGKEKHYARLMLDTGSSTTMLLDKDPDLDPHLSENKTVAVGLSGNINGSIGSLDEIQINSFVMKDIPVLLVASSNFAEHNLKHERIGTVGGGLFLAYSIVFDYAHNKFYMKRKHPSPNRVVVSL